MALLDPEDVRAHLAGEIPRAQAWAEHHGLAHTWNADALKFTLALEGASQSENEREQYLVIGTFEDYRAVPPTWRFVDPRNGSDIGLAAYPAPGSFQAGAGSVLHGNGVICAPWSRLAYGDKQGPHTDWTDATLWQTPAVGQTDAREIPDMLSRIFYEVAASPNRLAPLPIAEDAEAAA